MELRHFLSIFTRKIGVIILIILIGVGASIVTFTFSNKVYSATTTVIVNTNKGSIDLNDVMANQKLAKTYSLIAKGQRVLEKVIEELKLDYTIKELEKIIDISTEGDTEIIKISVKDINSGRAQSIANCIAYNFQDEIKQTLFIDNVKIIELAKLTNNDSRLQWIINIVAAVIISFICALIIVAIMDYMDDRIRADEIENRIDLPILGFVPKVNKVYRHTKGRKLFTDSYQNVWNNIRIRHQDNIAKTILITSPSYLEDKTSIAANLGISIAKANKSVLLIDCDMNKSSLHYFFNDDNSIGLSDILERDVHFSKVLKKTNIQNVDLITSGDIPDSSASLITSAKFNPLMNDISKIYDYIILIVPPVVASDTILISRFVQGIMMVLNHNESTYKMIVKAKSILEKIHTNIIGVIVNDAPPRYLKSIIYNSSVQKLNHREIERTKRLYKPNDKSKANKEENRAVQQLKIKRLLQ